MAGSYNHLVDGGGLSLIENMRDAAQCIEELFFLVRAHIGDDEIKRSLEAFYRFRRGESEPTGQTDYGRAYLETQEMMDQ